MRQPPPGPILVVGDVLLDSYLWGSCQRISPEAPVPVVGLQRRTHALGGAGNVVSNLRALGAEVELVSVVGQDLTAERVFELLEQQGVQTGGVLRQAGRATPEKTRIMAETQQVLRFDAETTAEVPAELEQQQLDLVQRQLAGAAAVVLSDYGKGALTERVCREVIDAARALGKPVLCDPKGSDYARYRRATAITPNRAEASLATRVNIVDQQSLEQAGQALLGACELDWLLITLGSEGMALFEPGAASPRRIQAGAREVFDVSGAGDTVIAALAYGLGSGAATLEACQLANTAAGIVVGKLGAARATPEEIDGATRPGLTRQSARKVLPLPSLDHAVQRLRRDGKRVVFTNGCFDLMHAGHVKFLEDAAALGDVLIVGLNTDDSIQRLKGAGRPIQDSQDRAALVAALQSVDYVVFFDEDTPRQLIGRLLPDVLVKGQDYSLQTVVGADQVQAQGGEVVVLPIMADRSTSATIRRILDTFGDAPPEED